MRVCTNSARPARCYHTHTQSHIASNFFSFSVLCIFCDNINQQQNHLTNTKTTNTTMTTIKEAPSGSIKNCYKFANKKVNNHNSSYNCNCWYHLAPISTPPTTTTTTTIAALCIRTISSLFLLALAKVCLSLISRRQVRSK